MEVAELVRRVAEKMGDAGPHPTVLASDDGGDALTRTRNRDLLLLNELFGQVPAAVLRHHLLSAPHSALYHSSNHLLDTTMHTPIASTSASASTRRDYRKHPGLLCRTDLFRTQSYTQAVLNLLSVLYPSVSRSSLQGFMAESNSSFGLTREAIEQMRRTRGWAGRVWEFMRGGSVSADSRLGSAEEEAVLDLELREELAAIRRLTLDKSVLDDHEFAKVRPSLLLLFVILMQISTELECGRVRHCWPGL